MPDESGGDDQECAVGEVEAVPGGVRVHPPVPARRANWHAEHAAALVKEDQVDDFTANVADWVRVATLRAATTFSLHKPGAEIN